MKPDPNLIFFACIAKGDTIVAEFNSQDADLGALAIKCLEKKPKFHSHFSQTIRNRTYVFLFDDPYYYFGIFDEKLEKSRCYSFLNSVKDSLNEILDQNPLKRLTTLKAHCLQGEINPIFHQLLAPPPDLDDPDEARMVLNNDSGVLGPARDESVGSQPLLGNDSKNLKKKKKKKKGILGDTNDDGGKLIENKLDVSDDDIILSREFSLASSHNKNGLFAVDQAKKVWKKHVWMVLSLDMIVCCILFGIWLGICRGFKCIDG